MSHELGASVGAGLTGSGTAASPFRINGATANGAQWADACSQFPQIGPGGELRLPPEKGSVYVQQLSFTASLTAPGAAATAVTGATGTLTVTNPYCEPMSGQWYERLLGGNSSDGYMSMQAVGNAEVAAIPGSSVPNYSSSIGHGGAYADMYPVVGLASGASVTAGGTSVRTQLLTAATVGQLSIYWRNSIHLTSL
jgi:hypothetical protein